MIKRVVTLLLIAAISLTVLTACGTKECDLCGEETKTKVLTVEGEKMNLCPDCYEDMKAVKEWLDSLS